MCRRWSIFETDRVSFVWKKQPTIDKKKQPYTPYYSKQTAFLSFFFCFISWMLGCCSDGWCLMCGSRFCLQLAFSRLTQVWEQSAYFGFNSILVSVASCSALRCCPVQFGCSWCCCQELELCWFFGLVLLGLHLGVGVVRLGYLVWCFPPEAPEDSTWVFFCFCCRTCLA
jgi:hypothetical protein